jgi:glycosyltransferase involved in cell wall biosynthesis
MMRSVFNGLKVVIVTYNWPPRNTIGTHRPYSWAKYWSSYGAKVTVLTAKKQGFDAPLDLQLPLLPGVVIKEVSYLGIARAGTYFLKSKRLRTIARRLKTFFSNIIAARIDTRKAWREAAREIAQRLAIECDVVVSTYGPAASHLLASDMKKSNPSMIWVADYRDLWSKNHFIKNAKLDVEHNLEISSVGEFADAITTVSNDLASRLKLLFSKRVKLIPNGFELEVKQLRQNLARSTGRSNIPLRIVYTGTIYKGHRDPTPLLQALAEMVTEQKLSHGDLTVDFYGERNGVAKELTQDKKFSPFVRIMGHVSREEALKAQRDASLLLLLESPAPEAKGVLTGKVFEYISSGVPVISLGSASNSEIGGLLRQTKTGICCEENIDLIKSVIKKLIDGEDITNWFSPLYQKIYNYSRKNQAKVFMDFIGDLL